MAQPATNGDLGRELGAPDPCHDGLDRAPSAGLADLLERLCHNALRFAVEAPRPPRVLRVRAGQVSIDVEWADALPVRGPVASPHPASPQPRYLTAPMVGVFYHAPEPEAAPFVQVGDEVAVGQQIGIVEAMKLMIPVRADLTGRVTAVLKGNAEQVEHGDRLFELAPSDPS